MAVRQQRLTPTGQPIPWQRSAPAPDQAEGGTPTPERSVAQWAQAEPAARDAVLDLAERAVALQPAAETAIQLYRLDRPPTTAMTEEGRRVAEAYLALGERLRSVDVDHPIGAILAMLLDRHLHLVRLALETVEPPASGAAGRWPPPAGLGQAAGDLVGVRDLLRRTLRIAGRAVTDLPAGGRL
ncbi:MAG TPA: hypothetical protein VG276_07140 [Actinomycetes bacterium]|nr:hypothetical protein [Actinomycetes bacterium]